jgi:protein-disulfide isomerase
VYAELVKRGRSEATPARRVTPLPPASSPRRGSAEAQILVQEFGDFDDPSTRLVEPTLKELLERYPRTIAMVWRDRPLSDRRSSWLGASFGRRVLGARGGEAFWAIHARLLTGAAGNGLTPAVLERFGADLHLAPASLHAGLIDPEHEQGIDADVAAAERAGVTRTPAFVISRATGCGASDRVDGYFLEGPAPLRKFKRLIERSLAE